MQPRSLAQNCSRTPQLTKIVSPMIIATPIWRRESDFCLFSLTPSLFFALRERMNVVEPRHGLSGHLDGEATASEEVICPTNARGPLANSLDGILGVPVGPEAALEGVSDVSALFGDEIRLRNGVNGLIGSDIHDLIAHVGDSSASDYVWYDGRMRKPGLIPLTRPAPVDSVTIPVFTESELGGIIAEDDPILWLRLNEAPGDDVNEQHFVGEATVNGSPSRLGIGIGFAFDGVDDSVFMGCDQLTNVPPRLLNEAEEFTVTLLLSSEYVASAGATRILRWGFNGIELDAYKFAGSDDSGYLTFRYYDEAGTTYTVEHYDASLYVPGTQMHVAITFDGASLKMFIDGVEVESETHSAIPYWGFSNTAENGLGVATNGPFGGSFYKGRVGEVAIFGSALSDARVLEHAEASREATLYNVFLLDPWATPTGLTSASSFHLAWTGEQDNPDDPTDRTLYTQASAKLTVPTTPSVEELYFWALQVYFYDDSETLIAGAHTGLQWAPGHPNSKAVNWGGYLTADSSILSGTESTLPSATENDNTRDYEWETGEEYTFRIFYVGDDMWRATVNDVTIRDLEVPGATRIAGPIFFSEVFAACEDPSHTVQWRDPYLYEADDTAYYFPQANKSYQLIDACDNTNSFGTQYFNMQTNTTRDEEETAINLRGKVRFDGFYPDSWPTGQVADEFNWSVLISDFPYDSYRIPMVYTGHEFVDGSAAYADAYVEIYFAWNTTKDVFNTIMVSGYYEDTVTETFYSLAEEGTALVDVVDLDVDNGRIYLNQTWTTNTTYELQLKLNGSTWELRFDGTLIFTFPNYSVMEGVNIYAFEAQYQTYCGGLKLKMGIGEVTAIVDEVEEVMDELFVDLDFNDCDDTDAYVEDGFFTFETNVTRTLAEGGETLSI